MLEVIRADAAIGCKLEELVEYGIRKARSAAVDHINQQNLQQDPLGAAGQVAGSESRFSGSQSETLCDSVDLEEIKALEESVRYVVAVGTCCYLAALQWRPI